MIRIRLILSVWILLVFLCASKKHSDKKTITAVLADTDTSDVQHEADDILILLTYSLVYNDWQDENVPREKRRGYNIGAVLVNSKNEPVAYDLNSINSTNDATQHGEVRLITKYINKTKCFNLQGFSLYTSLEPCIMCAGMITMTFIKRIIYGQHDVEYSHAFERLALDSRSIGGFGPYPRTIIPVVLVNSFSQELDSMYTTFLKTENEKILAKFLASDRAKEVFGKAHSRFLSYDVKHEENKKLLENALTFFREQTKEKRIKTN